MSNFPICPGVIRYKTQTGLNERDPVWIMGFVYENTETRAIVADKTGVLHRVALLHLRAITPACVHTLADVK